MAIKALTAAAVGLVAVGLSACHSIGSIETRAQNAAADKGRAEASIPFPDLPPACTAKMGRVKPGDEPRVITLKRWEIVADNRDRQSDDCAAWGLDMKARYARVPER